LFIKVKKNKKNTLIDGSDAYSSIENLIMDGLNEFYKWLD